MALSTPNCHGINVWGVTDKYSWIPGFSRYRNGAATLFDKNYQAKPAHEAVASVLKK